MRFIRRRKERIFRLVDQMKVTCTFQVTKFRSDGTITYAGPTFSNLVLDVGLDSLGERNYGVGAGSGNYINVGEDNTDPDTSQSGLLDFVAATENTYGSSNTGYNQDDPMHKWREVTFEFDIGSCTGNLTEVGLSADENDKYFNRQLFRDSNGDPTTITVKDDEGLRIKTRVYLYSDMQIGDTESGSFTLTTDDGDETIDVTREITDKDDWLTNFSKGCLASFNRMGDDGRNEDHKPEISNVDSGFEEGTEADSATKADYTSGDYYRDCEYEWEPGTFVGDLKTIFFPLFFPPPTGVNTRWEYYSAFRLDPAITIEDTDEFKVTMRRKWARYAS